MKTSYTTISSPRFPYAFAQPVEKLAFFDIETTGLSPKASSLYLIGVMYFDPEHKQWSLVQWFADDYRSEAAILEAFLDFITPFEALYHFNGATFDVPYVLAKCAKHQISPTEHCLQLLQNTVSHRTLPDQTAISVDLLKAIRPLKKKLSLVKANQTALEKWLGIIRKDTYDGGQLISVYAEYMQKKILHPQDAADLEALLLLHNHDDIAGMLEICSLLSYLDALQPADNPAVQEIHQENSLLIVSYSTTACIPKKTLVTHTWDCQAVPLPAATLSLQGQTGILTLPLFQGSLKYFFPSYKDYFYLPQEDTAIHKSVAQFVDPAFRQRATAATCYTKKEGLFVPSLSKKTPNWDVPRFYKDYKTWPAFYQYPAPGRETPSTEELLSQYLYYELPAF